MSVKTLPGFVILDWKETERQIMSGWQKMKARKTAAETAFGKAKAWCEETLTGLGAGSFALQMKEQIPVPQSFEEADKTIKRLEEACVMIQMGRDQIEESFVISRRLKVVLKINVYSGAIRSAWNWISFRNSAVL